MTRTKSFLNLLAISKLSILGAILVTTAVGADAMLIIGELFIFESNPYIGIVAYVIFPGIAAFGLMLIPAGFLLRAYTSHRTHPMGIMVRRLSRNKLVRLIFGLTLINFVIFAFVGYRSFHYMESPEFCGLVCHQVMRPEYTVYLRSPHSEVPCVDCHIGSGASWFVKSKLDGTRQLAAVLLDNYSRPIKTPIHNLRPARDVCEVCHRVESFHDNRIKIIQHFQPDEENTRTYSILNLRMGGDGENGQQASGIHWHISNKYQIRYFATDHRREDIVRVELTDTDGATRVWTRPGAEAELIDLDPESARLMDCIDCHNRPSHVYLPPERAMDDALANGLIEVAIPWIRKLSEEVITQQYESHDAAMAGIAELPNLYRERYPQHWETFEDAVHDAVPVLQDIHKTFVYPEMKIEWNTYPSLIGHPTAYTSGCFRCHNGVLVDQEGKSITTDCAACHFVLADNELDPVILRMLENR